MANGWSGGQYSVFRFLLGLYVLLDLMRCVGSDDQLLSAMSLLGIVLCVLLMVGWMDRPAAIALVLMGLVLVVAGGDRSSRTLLMGGSSLWFLLPVIAVVVPPAPYGSLSAKGRSDPAGSWEMGQGLYLAIWLSLCGGYAGLGLDLVLDPSWWSSRGMRIGNTSDWPVALGAAANWLLVGTWLAFAPLTLVSKLRRWVWLVAMIEAVVVLPLAGLGSLALGLGVWHLAAFDPAWLRARRSDKTETIFYDGYCGLCHRWVRFVLAEDKQGDVFNLSPLQGQLIGQTVPSPQREQLPDSIVVKGEGGALLTRSAAILYILDRLGGLWRIAAILGGVVPQPARDVVYRTVARIRHKVFARPNETCPVLPAHLLGRFKP